MSSMIPVLISVLVICNSDYLYMSYHHTPNIMAYNVDTETLSTQSLLDISGVDWTSSDNLHFRGLTVKDDILYVANSKEDYSFVGKWQCNQNQQTGGLTFISNFTGESYPSNNGLNHPYGIRWYGDYLYVSTQDTQSVLLYNSSGDPQSTAPDSSSYPGSVITYGPFDSNGNGVRDIAVDKVNGLLFVAQQTLQMVLCYDITNNYKSIFNITYGNEADPIGLKINTDLYPNTIFIGDNGNNTIYAFNYNDTAYNPVPLWTSQYTKHLDHPAGIDVNEQYLFVVSQNKNYILQYNASTGDYISKAYDFGDLSVTGENLKYVAGNGC